MVRTIGVKTSNSSRPKANTFGTNSIIIQDHRVLRVVTVESCYARFTRVLAGLILVFSRDTADRLMGATWTKVT